MGRVMTWGAPRWGRGEAYPFDDAGCQWWRGPTFFPVTGQGYDDGWQLREARERREVREG